MSLVIWVRDDIAALARARKTVLCIAVRELGVPWSSRHMVGVVRAVLGVGSSVCVLLLGLHVQVDHGEVEQLVLAIEIKQCRECDGGANKGCRKNGELNDGSLGKV